MTTKIKLPVVEFNKSILSKIYWVSFAIVVVVFLILFIMANDENNQIGKLFVLTFSLFAIGILFLKNPYSHNDFLTISKDAIEYKTESYLTKDISEIKFLYNGYKGKPMSINIMYLSSGYENILKFKHKGTDLKFNIELKYEYLGLLRRVFSEFESVGIPISVLNSWGKKIKL